MTYVFWKWLAIYLLPFLLALLIAAILEPLVDWLRQCGLPGVAAVWLALLTGLMVVVGVTGIALTVLIAELARLAGMLPRYLGEWQYAVDHWLKRAGELRQGLGLSPSVFNAQLNSGFKMAEALVRQVLMAAAGLPAGLLIMVVATIAVFFLLRDGRAIRLRLDSVLPHPLNGRLAALELEVMAGTLGFLKAQLTLVGLTAGATTLGLWAIGSGYAVALGILAGVLDLVPFLGPPALIVPWAAVLAVLGNKVGAVKLLGVLVGVALTRQLVEPRLVGNRTGLHPLWVLLAFYVGIQMFGPIGFVVGPISAVVLRALGRMLLDPPPSISA
jgi:sporulation integral membrane protein YtvI